MDAPSQSSPGALALVTVGAMTRRRSTALLACAVLLLTAGCGGAERDDGRTSPTAVASHGADAATHAESALPRPSDFPTGWEAQGETDVETDVTLALGSGCLPQFPAEAVAVAPMFIDYASRQTMRWTTVVMSGKAEARKVMRALDTAEVSRCIARRDTEKLRAAVPEGTTISTPRKRTVELPVLGDERVVQAYVSAVSMPTHKTQKHDDTVAIRVGSAIVFVIFVGSQPPSEQEPAPRLLKLTVERLRAATR